MTKTESIRELRSLTQAGMKDCNDALVEANWDLEKAVDIIKTKGQNITSGRQGRVASEGIISVLATPETAVMVEVNCQTDFTARSPGFVQFAAQAADELLASVKTDGVFNSTSEALELGRTAVVSTTKENVVIRRWFAEQAVSPSTRVFSYGHSNSQIGVLLTLTASSVEAANSPEFIELGNDLAMQVAAMSPLAVSVDRLDPQEVSRQVEIFKTQLQEAKKPQAQWEKIISGKSNKWHTEVCLLNQESIIVPKTTVANVVANVAKKLNTEITVVNFIRAQVGEGIAKEAKEDLQSVVAQTLDDARKPFGGRL